MINKLLRFDYSKAPASLNNNLKQNNIEHLKILNCDLLQDHSTRPESFTIQFHETLGHNIKSIKTNSHVDSHGDSHLNTFKNCCRTTQNRKPQHPVLRWFSMNLEEPPKVLKSVVMQRL